MSIYVKWQSGCLEDVTEAVSLLLPLPLLADPSLALRLQPDLSGLVNPLFAADAQNNLIIAAMVSDCSRPVLHAIGSCGEYWIVKYDPTGQTLLFATYLGALYTAGQARGAALRDVRVDLNGNCLFPIHLKTANQHLYSMALESFRTKVNAYLRRHSYLNRMRKRRLEDVKMAATTAKRNSH